MEEGIKDNVEKKLLLFLMSLLFCILESDGLTRPVGEECPSRSNSISVLHNGSHPICRKSPDGPRRGIYSCGMLECLPCLLCFFACKKETSEMCIITNIKQSVCGKNDIRSWWSYSRRAVLAGNSHTLRRSTRLCLPRARLFWSLYVHRDCCCGQSCY